MRIKHISKYSKLLLSFLCLSFLAGCSEFDVSCQQLDELSKLEVKVIETFHSEISKKCAEERPPVTINGIVVDSGS